MKMILIKQYFRFNSQGKEIRFGNYVFGPVVMRLFYHMNDYKTALSVSCLIFICVLSYSNKFQLPVFYRRER